MIDSALCLPTVICLCASSIAIADSFSVNSRTDLTSCAYTPPSQGESERQCVIESTLQGPISLTLPANGATSLTIECSPPARVEWASTPNSTELANAFAIRIHPDSQPDWSVTLRNCDLSDLGEPGSQTVQGPVLINNGNIPGIFVLDGIVFETEAYGLSTIAGGINPNSNTRLRVINSFAFAPICWDAKSVSIDGQPIVHEFLNNECRVNDRAEVLAPRALKIEGATHVVSRGNEWLYGQFSQSDAFPFSGEIIHRFEDDYFRHRSDSRLARNAVFFAAVDSSWDIEGLLELEGEPGPTDIARSRAGIEAEFDTTGLMVTLVPEPGAVLASCTGVLTAVLMGLARRQNAAWK